MISELLKPKTEDAIFSALADENRRWLLINLAENSPKTATQLARDFNALPRHEISRQGVLKHLNILEHAGLVTVQPRGREKRYSLQTEPLQTVSAWIDLLSAQWDARLQRLKALVETDDSL
jgi:DNA-binding transcriptional ArsR family regulator